MQTDWYTMHASLRPDAELRYAPQIALYPDTIVPSGWTSNESHSSSPGAHDGHFDASFLGRAHLTIALRGRAKKNLAS
jgi:hypothetical protein